MQRYALIAGFPMVFLLGLMLGAPLWSRKPEPQPGADRAAGGAGPAGETPSGAADENAASKKEGATAPEQAAPGKKPSGTPAEQKARPDESGGGFALSPAKYDYGKVLEGEARTHEFKVTRPPGTELQLGRLYSPCPCIRVRAASRQVPADKEAEVEVWVHSLTLEGKKSFPFYAEVLKPEHRTLRGDVSIEVERVPAKVLVKPRALHLGSVRGAKATEVRLLNLTTHPLALGKMSCSLEGVKVSLPTGSRIEPGRHVTVRLEVPETGLPPGPIRGTVRIETNCPEHAAVDIPVDGTALRPRDR